MKKLLLLLTFAVTANTFFAQNVKRYVLLEHFTNTNCSVCKSKNPSLYTTIAPYAADVHHVSFHPSVPYSSCVLYQQNPVENDSRANFYGVDGTPRAVLNGVSVAVGSQLLPLASLQPTLNQTSPIEVKVTENAGTNRTANIKIKTLGTAPTASYKLYVAVVEKVLNLTTANGETVHNDVFRKFLTVVSGNAITLPALGSSADFSFPYSLQSGWGADQIYVLAWVQRVDNKEVMNSGTRFDVTNAAKDITENESDGIQILQNPVRNGELKITVGDWNKLEFFDTNGKLIQQNIIQAFETKAINVSSFQSGIFYAKFSKNEKSVTKKIIVTQ